VEHYVRSFGPRNSFEWAFVVLLPLKIAGAVAFAMSIGEPHWIALWLVTASGSALIVAGGVWLIDIVASGYPGRAAAVVRVIAGACMAAGWLFGVAVSAIVAFHPVYLMFILLFSGLGLGVGTGLGLAIGATMSATGGPRAPSPPPSS
jgi:hypothetical protein